MLFNPNKEFIVGFVLKELGKDIPTLASKQFKMADKVPASKLDEFAKNVGMIFQQEQTSVGNMPIVKISILDLKERVHLTALEFLRGVE